MLYPLSYEGGAWLQPSGWSLAANVAIARPGWAGQRGTGYWTASPGCAQAPARLLPRPRAEAPRPPVSVRARPWASQEGTGAPRTSVTPPLQGSCVERSGREALSALQWRTTTSYCISSSLYAPGPSLLKSYRERRPISNNDAKARDTLSGNKALTSWLVPRPPWAAPGGDVCFRGVALITRKRRLAGECGVHPLVSGVGQRDGRPVLEVVVPKSVSRSFMPLRTLEVPVPTPHQASA